MRRPHPDATELLAALAAAAIEAALIGRWVARHGLPGVRQRG